MVRASISELPALVERMRAEGWSRLLSVPNTICVPGYQEALQESHELVATEDRQRAKERVEAAQDVARAVKDEVK